MVKDQKPASTKKAPNQRNRPSRDEIQLVQETLVVCLNGWRARLKADDQRAALVEVSKLDDAGQRAALKDVAKSETERAALLAKALATEPLSMEYRDKLFTKCIEGVRLLLLSYGPNPGGDEEFIKLLLYMKHMSSKAEPEDKETEPDEQEIKPEKRQLTLTEYFT